ncbi:MAG: DNA adenine methylase [Chloroflexota bacterium]|nr:MAG: DNA adenine methylase [Chloroflexota bacterium]
MIRSPLRYPGGKSKALQQIQRHMPSGFEEFREPFVGGGSLFISVRQRYPGVRVWINDLNHELFSFWVCARDHLDELVSRVLAIKETRADGRELFQELTTVDVNGLTQLERAVRFFVLNRISFSGTVEAGGYSERAFHARFTYSSIERLRALEYVMDGVRITDLDYREVIHQPGEGVFVFLDPPYYSATDSRLYGRNGVLHTVFDHGVFADEMRKCPHQWLITYDDSETIRTNFPFAHQYAWTLQYGMNNYKRSYAEKGNELIITSYPVDNSSGSSSMSCGRAYN